MPKVASSDVAASFHFKLHGLRHDLTRAEGREVEKVVLRLFDDWGETLGYEVLTFDLDINLRGHEIAALMDLRLKAKHAPIDHIEEMLADPDDDGNYPIEIRGKDYLIFGRKFEISK